MSAARARCLGLLAASCLLGACVVVSDQAGVRISAEQASAIRPGSTTRAQLLAELGPPTGFYSADLLAIVSRVGAPLSEPGTPGRIDDDVFTWQHVEVHAWVLTIPIFFGWVDATVTSRTLTVFFDERGVVRYSAWREDTP